MLGCGNAKLSEEMYNDGFKNIENIDISQTVITQQQERYAEKIPEMKWTQMDGKKMAFEDGSFDCIIDKACLDSILCGENSAPNSKLMLDEIYRVLSPNGVYICVSYGLPEMRLVYFNKYDWKNQI